MSPTLTAVLLLLTLTLAMSTLASAQQQEAIGGAGFGLKPTEDGRVLVERIAPGGPAAKAGLQPGDRILLVNGRRVEDLPGTQLVDTIRGPVGSKLVVTYVRGNGRPTEVTMLRAVLGPPPGTGPMSPFPAQPGAQQPPPPAPSPATPPPSRGTATAPARGALKLLPQSIKDPAVNNITAVTYLLPQGWQSQGDILWMHQFSVLANLRLRMTDPASGTTLEWLPTQHFSYTDQLPGLAQPGMNWQGAIFAPPIADPAQFVEAFWAPQVLSHLRGRRPIARDDYPAQARLAVANDTGWRAQSVRLRYAFDRQGKPWEEDVYFTLAYAPNTAGVAMWNVQGAWSARAPKGELDANAGTLKTVVANTQFTPQWLASYSVVKQLFRQGIAQQMVDTAAFGRSLQQYNAHIQQLGQQMHEERMRSFDRIAESQREYLGGVETFTDPYARQGVYMPAGYKEHWVNEKGEVVMSSVPGFDPNVGDTGHWKKMERRDPMKQR